MHLLLTDHLTCPRCGPEFGLIVLADGIEDRRVVSGSLGCANCRHTYPIAGGVGDLRVAGSEPLSFVDLAVDEERAFRTAALLGVTTPRASVLIMESAGQIGATVADILDGVHVIAISGANTPPRPRGEAVLNLIRSGAKLPFRTGSIAGVALLGVDWTLLVDEVRRVAASGARVVVEPADQEVAAGLRDAGLPILLQQDGVVVAGGSEPG